MAIATVLKTVTPHGVRGFESHLLRQLGMSVAKDGLFLLLPALFSGSSVNMPEGYAIAIFSRKGSGFRRETLSFSSFSVRFDSESETKMARFCSGVPISNHTRAATAKLKLFSAQSIHSSILRPVSCWASSSYFFWAKRAFLCGSYSSSVKSSPFAFLGEV